MFNILKKVLNIFLIIIIVLLGLYIILRFTNTLEIYEVQTGSMEDGIQVGDYILINKRSNYKVNDVITFERDDGYITHRIVSIEEDKIITKGDANNTEDDAIDKKSVIGKVIIIGGILNILINYKYIIITFLLILYLITCRYNGKEDNKNKKKK